ncbi:hypothetical protein ACS33_01835 [Edwardsiella ictaluri]|nr:hypothetical protein ACS33_01835 [Edwardsiella ictaluri]
MKITGVLLGVFTDGQAIRQTTAAIDDAALQAAATPDVDLRHQNAGVNSCLWGNLDTGGEDRVMNLSAVDDAASADQGIFDDVTCVAGRLLEACRRQLGMLADDGPVRIERVQTRRGADQIDVGLPVGVQSTDIAPIASPSAVNPMQERPKGCA